MHRRRYLGAVGASLAPLVAGCSSTGSSETPTESPTGTDTDTATRTSTETEYADSPGDIEIPRYIELLPDKHLGGTERTDNANFVRVDWEWYLRMREEPMEFGAAAKSDWTLEPTEENFATAPEYDILKGPVNAVLTTAFIIENIIGEFPNAGPEILRQCGLEGAEDDQGSNPEVEEVISYAQPGVMYFVGVDTESFRSAVQENDSRSYDNIDITAHTGAEKYSGRDIYVSNESKIGIVAFESGNADSAELQPTLRRLGGANESVANKSSVNWCLSRLNTAPIVTGEIDGGEQKLAGSGYSNPGVSRLSEYDTIFQSFETSGTEATVQLITSHINGTAPSAEKLRETYIEADGSFTTTYHPNVSKISAKF
jgi:hypothetical protein